jgi:hypothetical protein
VSTRGALHDAAPALTPWSRLRRLPLWAVVVVAGITWWFVGFLPWIVASALDGSPWVGVTEDTFPAVPLIAGQLGALVAGAFAGGLVAGGVGLAAPAGDRRLVALATFGGMAAVAAIAFLQAGRVMGVPGGFGGDRRVVLGLTAIAVLATVEGWALGSCWIFGRPGLGVGLGALSGVVPAWLGTLAVTVINAMSPTGTITSLRGINWAAALVLAPALVVVGVRPLSRLAWWPVVLVVAWLVVPALTAAGYMEVYLRSGAGLPGTLPEVLAATRQVFGQALLPGNRYVLPWVVAVVLAAVVAVVLARRPARSSGPAAT